MSRQPNVIHCMCGVWYITWDSCMPIYLFQHEETKNHDETTTTLERAQNFVWYNRTSHYNC